MACPKTFGALALMATTALAAAALPVGAQQTAPAGAQAGPALQNSVPANQGAANSSSQPGTTQNSLSQNSASIVLDGLKKQIADARSAFASGKLTPGIKALDEAHKVLKVMVYASGGADPFTKAEKQVAEIRHKIQLGQLDVADKDTGALENALAQVTAQPFSAPPLTGAYKGGSLINAKGQFLGEVTGVDAQTMRARIGGWSDVLGFIDFGGSELSFPLAQVIPGEIKQLGATMLVWPTKAEAKALLQNRASKAGPG